MVQSPVVLKEARRTEKNAKQRAVYKAKLDAMTPEQLARHRGENNAKITPEQKRAKGIKSRDWQRKKSAARTPEERAAFNIRSNAVRKARRHAMTPEERAEFNADQKARRDTMTPEECAGFNAAANAKRADWTPEQRARSRATKRAYKEAKITTMTPEEFASYFAEMRNKRLVRYYGITTDEWEVLFDSQGRLCACCGINKPGSHGRWVTDHDHTKKKGDAGFIRGILCSPCNTGIGTLGDTLEDVECAVVYLRKTQSA